MVALFAITAFAAQIWKAETEPTVLINYPTSSDGIKISGTTKSTTVKIHTNKDAVNCYQLANGYTTDGAYNNNSISLGVEGGFKAGDVITIAGAINNSSSEKRGTAVLFTMDSEKNITNLHQFSDFINGRLVNDEPVEESYTLEADADSLYLGRDGNTGANLTLIKVVRPASSGGDEPTPSDETYWVETAPSDLKSGDIVAIVDVTSSMAMPNNNGTASQPKTAEVTLSSDKAQITSDVADTLQWVVTVNSETTAPSYQFGVANTEDFLYCTNSNNGVRVGTNANNVFTIYDNNGTNFLLNSGTSRYLGVYNNQDWRCYTSINTNIQGCVTKFYKKSDTAPIAANVATPVIEGETPFVGSTTVTITCETEGAAIYYSTDGVDPTDQSTAYTEPFELTESATVKAIAYDASGAKSAVASKVFEATPSVATIAAMNALENDAAFGFTGNALIVAKPTAKHVFIKDDTGSSLLYDNSGEKTAAAEVGKVIAPNWTAKVSIYKNLFEAVPDAAIEVTSDDPVDVTYPEVELAYITAEHVNEVVTLKGVNYTAPDNKNFNVTKGTDNTVVAGYNQFGIEIANPDETKTYDIVGAIGRYNDNIQFQPITITEATEEPAPEENVLWSGESTDVNWGWAIAISNDKISDIAIGDVVRIYVDEILSTDNDWSSQVALKDNARNTITDISNIGKETAPLTVDIPITGDVYSVIKDAGFTIGNGNYKTSKIALVKGVYPDGTENSIWLGNWAMGWYPAVTINKVHVTSNFTIKAGDVLRVTTDAAAAEPNLKLASSAEGWPELTGEKTIEGATVSYTVTADDVTALASNDLILQGQDANALMVELIPAKEEMTDLYIVGDFDGWNTATNTPNLVKMTYNEETEAFEKEVTVTSKAYFVFGDVASSDSWDDFNANNRYAASDEEAEVVEGQPIQLQKATGTLTISNPGTYTLSVTKDLLLSITQTSAGQDTYIVAGTPSSIFGTEWDGTNEANKMTFDEATGTYSITYNVTEATNDVQLKVVKNQSEWIGDATGNNVTFNVTSPCEITVTYNPETGEITVTGDGVVFPTDFTYEAVYAVGNGSEGWLNNVAWDPAAEANKMTEVEEDVWEITYSAVPVGTGYQVKFAIDGGWTNNFGGTFAAFNEETDAVYNGDNIIFDVADEAKDITIRLDLKDFDFASKTGAKFTIKTAGEEPEPEPTADGDIISWTADDIASAGGTASSYSVGDFVLNVVDTDGKIAVDANTAYFGDATAQKKFTHRLKTGGKSSSKNRLTLTVPSAGKVKVYVRTGSNSATDRNLTLTQNGTTLYDKVVQESDAVQVAEDDLNVTNEEPAAGAKALAEGDPATVKVYPAVEIDAVAGTVEIGYPTGSLNFYGFEFISDEVTGIQNVETLDINPMFDENLPAYNLAGQRVDKNYRGVVIQKGKKFFNK